MHDDAEGVAGDVDDIGEVVQRVEVRPVGHLRQAEDGDRHLGQGVAVGPRVLHHQRAERAGHARAVLDHDRLAQVPRGDLGHRAHLPVGRPARRPGNDQADRTVGEPVLLRGGGPGERGARAEGEGRAAGERRQHAVGPPDCGAAGFFGRSCSQREYPRRRRTRPTFQDRAGTLRAGSTAGGRGAAGSPVREGAKPRLRCRSQSTGNGSSKAGRARSAGCRPSRIASTMSGASSVSRSSAAEVAALDPLRRRHLADRGVAPLVQQPLVPERPRQRLHQRRIGARRQGRLAAVAAPASPPSSAPAAAGWSAAPGP